MDYYLRSYDECGQTATPDIAPDKLALIIQQCNAFTKRVGVNPNLAAPIEPLSESAARQT